MDLPVGENYSDHPCMVTYWNLRERGLALGDVQTQTPECDWTSGMPVDWVAFHRHDDAATESFVESKLDAQERERVEKENRAHTESLVLYV
jgi:hypothetical protein